MGIVHNRPIMAHKKVGSTEDSQSNANTCTCNVESTSIREESQNLDILGSLEEHLNMRVHMLIVF